MDVLEAKYIKELKTMYPNGYNMTAGGRCGNHSEISNEKKKVPRREYSEEAKENMRKGQATKRYEKRNRKYDDDHDLPKYISSKRVNGVLMTYTVRFPMGIERKEIINKTFSIEDNKREEALKSATDFLTKLEHEYSDKLSKYLNEKKIKEECEKHKVITKEILPNHVYPIVEENITIGYSVFGLKDSQGVSIPRREFKGHVNSINLEHAVKFLRLVKEKNENEEIVSDWLTASLPENIKSADLPTYVRPTSYKGVKTGYRVDFFVKYEDEKPIIISKCYSSKKKTMEEKLAMAEAFVEEMTAKYKTDNKISS